MNFAVPSAWSTTKEIAGYGYREDQDMRRCSGRFAGREAAGPDAARARSRDFDKKLTTSSKTLNLKPTRRLEET